MPARVGRDREAHEVHRRAPRVPHAGGVHAAHRPGRPARHRRRSATRSCCGRRSCRSTRSPALASSRHVRAHARRSGPTYNMAANLVRRYPPDAGPPPAQPLVRPVPGRPRRGAARGAARAAHAPRSRRCGRGRVRAVGDSRSTARSRPRPRAQPRRPRRPVSVDGASHALRPGDVIVLAPGKHAVGPRVLTVAQRARWRQWRVRVITPTPRARSLGRPTSTRRRRRVGTSSCRCRTPRTTGRSSSEVATRCRRGPASTTRARRPHDTSRSGDATCDGDLRGTAPEPRPRIAGRRRRPSASSARSARPRAAASRARPSRWPAGSTACSASSRRWGYLDGWSLTDAGDGSLAALPRVRPADRRGARPAACSTTSTRRAGRRWCRASPTSTAAPRPPPPPWFPSASVRDRSAARSRLGAELDRDRGRARGCRATRPPDPAFVALAHAWAAGDDLDDVLEDEDLSGGDFVRNVKQLIDLLRQIADVARWPPPGVAAAAAARLFRGVRRGVVHRVDDVESERRDDDRSDGRARGVEPRALPADGVIVRVRRRSRVRSSRDAAGRWHRAPDARAARRRPVPHARRHRRRVAAARIRCDHAPDRPRRGRVDGRPLVRRPSRRPRSWWRGRVWAAMNARVPRATGTSRRAHPSDGLLDTLDVTMSTRRPPESSTPARHRHPRAAPCDRAAARGRDADGHLRLRIGHLDRRTAGRSTRRPSRCTSAGEVIDVVV